MRVSRKHALLWALVAMNYSVVQAQTTIDSKFGKGFVNLIAKDSSWKMKAGLRFQTLYVGEWGMGNASGERTAESDFLIRRARLKFGGYAFTPKLEYKLELGLSNRDISGVSSETKGAPRFILDAVVKWNFFHNFWLWAGQTKLPGNRERVISSGDLQFVDRSLLNKRFNIDRDMGLQLRHHFNIGNMVVKEAVAFSQGEGRNITAGNLGGYDWTARLEFLPFGHFDSKGKDDYVGSCLKRQEKPKLAIGATYDFHDRAVRTRGNTGDFMYTENGYYMTDIQTIFADMMFKYRGLSIMAEYAKKFTAEGAEIALDELRNPTGDVVYVGTGLNAQVGYLFKKNWEVAARYTAINPEASVDDNHYQYTLGLSKYFAGHKLKVQSDVSLLQESDKDNQIMFRLQVDVHF